ncbi:MAG TPA: NAD(P)H-hydrate dehydratase [Candidatus Sulfotelmatobacter sp.]|nr:NAD(P)H-hydrate dehydratase [Candidatus Sulfotelmatobacter sp.]
MRALTAAEMREVDRLTTERHGISSLQLMETAGTRAANAFARSMRDAGLEPPREICVLCGKGNNGGDGFVVARHLRSAAANVFVVLFAGEEELRGDAATNFQRWREVGGEVVFVADEPGWESVAARVMGADVIIDAIFGTGFRGVAAGAMGRAIRDVNWKSKDAKAVSPALILAVDTPSGLPSDGEAGEEPILKAHHTVTFTAPKVGQLISRNAAAAGSLSVVSIGSPVALVEEIGKSVVRWIEPDEFADMPLVRKSDGHKGLYGNILIVAGSLGKSGAAVMSGSAALWSGAGLVTVATPDVVLPIVAGAHPEYMTEPLAATKDGTIARSNLGERFVAIAKGRTVIAIGPGLGQDEQTQEFVRSVVKTSELPVVLDADGLNAFTRRADELRERNSKFLAITPHPGEMARLLGGSVKDVEADRVKTATDAAKRWNAHVILKGSHTIVAAPDGRMLVNTTGNAGLSKGGSGDVLTGVLAAMTGQFKTDDWLQTLSLGVFLHGAAADVAGRGTDLSGIVASDVARSVPQARRELLRELQRRD